MCESLVDRGYLQPKTPKVWMKRQKRTSGVWVLRCQSDEAKSAKNIEKCCRETSSSFPKVMMGTSWFINIHQQLPGGVVNGIAEALRLTGRE